MDLLPPNTSQRIHSSYVITKVGSKYLDCGKLHLFQVHWSVLLLWQQNQSN